VRVEYNTILVEYLKVFLTLPVVILIIVVMFCIKFSSAIDFFIRNLKLKYKDLEATSQQVKDFQPDSSPNHDLENEIIKLSKQDVQEIASGIENLQNSNQTNLQRIDQLQQLVTQLANRSENFEFMYLNRILVVNTKIVLMNLFKVGSLAKEMFIINIFVPSTLPDPQAEKIAIFNALLVNGLIYENGSIVSVSEKGIRYLKFINFIQ